MRASVYPLRCAATSAMMSRSRAIPTRRVRDAPCCAPACRSRQQQHREPPGRSPILAEGSRPRASSAPRCRGLRPQRQRDIRTCGPKSRMRPMSSVVKMDRPIVTRPRPIQPYVDRTGFGPPRRAARSRCSPTTRPRDRLWTNDREDGTLREQLLHEAHPAAPRRSGR